MPIYLYQCEACGLRFERMQRISEGPLADCPECSGRVHRIIQPVGIIFRGSGFYVTDNRQVSSPTLKPSKEPDKSQEMKEDRAKEDKAEESRKPKAESLSSAKAESE